MGEQIKIKRRISAHPADLGITSTTQPSAVCPDIFETESGDFVIIGSDVTSDVGKEIPEDAVISKGERVVLIPRVLLLSAFENLKREDSMAQ
ncbi:MAG: hypothetical protein KAT65_00760 [Methanophagales archaeon]|nr:hypothetical protein [Methanophagales archaeon]